MQLISKIVNQEANPDQWTKYFIGKDSELDTQYSNLVFGTQNRIGDSYRRVGYQILRDFFDGDQWTYKPEGGQVPRVYNHVRNVVLNYTAFMTNEPIDVDVPPIDITDEIEVARAEAKEKALIDVLQENKFDTLFEAAVQNGSLLGDSIILGPFYDEDEEKIIIQNVKYPENVRIIWSDDTYTKVIGFIHHYYVSEETAYKMFPDSKKEGVKFETQTINQDSYGGNAIKTGRVGPQSPDNVGIRMVKLMDCWTDTVHQLIVGGERLSHDEHNWGFVPIIHIPNILHPTEPFGISDIEDLLDTQVEINERNADMSEVISETAFPYIFGKNLDPVEVQSGAFNLIDIGDEGEIVTDPRRGNAANLSNEITRRMSSMFQLSGLNENIFGGQGVRAVTGRALSVLMQTVNNRVKGRQTRWTESFKELFANIFVLMEEYGGKNGKQLIGGYYKTDIFFPGTLLRNITDEINKFNAKLQSQQTTMKNLGVPSPKDEEKLMKKELQDQIMMIEISRNPGLQLQVKQMLEQQLAQQVAGQKPTLREDENEEGASPMAQGGAPQQSALGAEGAVAQAAQRAGGSVAEEGEEV